MRKKPPKPPLTVREDDLVFGTRDHNATYEVAGTVVSVDHHRRVIEVRVQSAVSRKDRSPAPDDPWLRPGAVVRSAAFLWRKL